MAIVYTNTLKDLRLQQVIDQMDLGSGAAKLEIATTGFSTLLVTITLADPSATKSAGVLSFSGLPKSGTAVATGTAAEARIRDSDDNDVITGLTVGTGSEDIVLDNDSIATDQVVNVTAAAITHG